LERRLARSRELAIEEVRRASSARCEVRISRWRERLEVLSADAGPELWSVVRDVRRESRCGGHPET
jgi:hypothetical protein